MPAEITDMGRRLALEAVTSSPIAGPLTAMLVDDTHVFGAEYSNASDVPDEISATNYARAVVVTASVTTQPDGRVSAAFDPTSFGLVGGALDDRIGGCYLIANSGNDATSPVLHAVPFAAIQETDGTILTIQWSQISAQFVPVLS